VKIFKLIGASVLVVAMLINVQMNNVDTEALLLKDDIGTIAMAKLEDDGGTGFVICRCHVGYKCLPGRLISFRKRCDCSNSFCY